MREIKFRGKRYGDGAWVYGSLYQGTKEGEKYSVILNDSGYHLAPQDDRNLAIAFAENEVNVVIPDTIGQFTGLHDKNGKEIYEGDIIRGNCGHGEVRHLISFFDMTASFVAEILPDNDINDYCTASQIWILKYDKEVLGNIHDNPELLNK